ncbi:YDG domain-containing protein, partial [Flavobacterium palustre]
SSKNVGTYTSFTVNSLTSSNSNYKVTGGTVGVDIMKKDLTVTAVADNKIFDGNTTAVVTLTTDAVAGDDITVSYFPANSNFADFNVGTWKVTVTGISIGGADAPNYNLTSTTAIDLAAEITIASTITTLITSAPSVRFMDNLTMTARVTPANTAQLLTGSVKFFINGVSYGTASIVPVPGTSNSIFEATIIKQVAENPGTYNVVGVFTPGTPSNYDESTSLSKPLTVVARNADPYDAKGFYTGDVFAWTTGPNSSKGTLTMTAMIKDKNLPKGDLRGAKVTFCYVNNGVWSPIPSAKDIPVGLVDINDGSIGFASAIVQFDIGSQNAANYQVGVLVTGAYSNETLKDCGLSQVIVSVSKPISGGFICGGSRFVNPVTTQQSAGYIKGVPGLCTDYQFDIQYTKSGTNPKGKVKVLINSYYKTDGILDDKLHTYIITTNAIASMVATAPRGTFSAKANLVEQIGETTVAIEGGATFQMTAYQCGTDQKIAITLYRKAGGIWFSSSWDGTKTVEKAVGSGSKVYVDGGGNCQASVSTVTARVSTPTISKQVIETPVIFEEVNKTSEITKPIPFDVIAYPNPSNNQFTITLVGASSEKVSVQVFDLLGKLIKVIEKNDGEPIVFGEELPLSTYIAIVTQGDNRKTIKLVKH